MSLEASTATPHLDAEGQFSLALEPAGSVEMPATNHSDTLLSNHLVNSHDLNAVPISESLWVSMSNGEQLHLRHFMPSKLDEADKPAERILCFMAKLNAAVYFTVIQVKAWPVI